MKLPQLQKIFIFYIIFIYVFSLSYIESNFIKKSATYNPDDLNDNLKKVEQVESDIKKENLPDPNNNVLKDDSRGLDTSKIPLAPPLLLNTSPLTGNNIPKAPQLGINILKAPNLQGIPNIPTIPGKPGFPNAPALPLNKVGINTLPSPRNGPKLKVLFWNKIPNSKVDGSIWEKMDTNLSINKEKLENAFQQKQNTNVQNLTNKVDTTTKPTTKSILSDSRKQNFEIVYKKLKTDYKVICEAVRRFDESFTLEKFAFLKSFYLKEDEKANLSQINPDTDEYSDLDKLVQCLYSIDKFENRITAVIFKSEYQKDFENVNKIIQNFKTIYNFLENDQRIKEWLKYILAYGNFLNEGNIRGNALGFEINIITKIIELRTSDNKSNLLETIIENINDENLTNIDFDFSYKFSDINEIKKPLIAQYNQVKELNNDPDEEVQKFLNFFWEDLSKKIVELNDGIKEIENTHKRVANLYREKETIDIDEFFNIFKKFLNDIKISKLKVRERQEKEQRALKNKNRKPVNQNK